MKFYIMCSYCPYSNNPLLVSCHRFVVMINNVSNLTCSMHSFVISFVSRHELFIPTNPATFFLTFIDVHIFVTFVLLFLYPSTMSSTSLVQYMLQFPMLFIKTTLISLFSSNFFPFFSFLSGMFFLPSYFLFTHSYSFFYLCYLLIIECFARPHHYNGHLAQNDINRILYHYSSVYCANVFHALICLQWIYEINSLQHLSIQFSLTWTFRMKEALMLHNYYFNYFFWNSINSNIILILFWLFNF